jgi:hypothetical protein
MDGKEHFTHMPLTPRTRTLVPELVGRALAERAAPLADGLICEADPAGEQACSDIARAEAEAEGAPDTRADDLDREAVVLVTVRGWCAHATSMAHQPGIGQAALPLYKLTMPRRVLTT